ncbi:DUF4296 domain-containing protein [Pontimicrobium sp. IMCC45349]|uniref:DUF4296 domain-containing protein n=1 Tax=Pontimicrobium sp. IMCC45349 TaxID=3391574 RepID=UPI0039A35B35
MIKRLTYITFLFLFLVSCQKNEVNKPKRPDNLISKGKMVEIIYDMSLITVAKGVNKRLLEESKFNPKKYVYDKYGIDSLQFVESNNYYAYNLKEYDEIYTQVKEKLNKEKEKYNKAIDAEKKSNDSLKAIGEKRKVKLDSTRKLKKRERKKIKNKPLIAVDSSRVSTRQ